MKAAFARGLLPTLALVALATRLGEAHKPVTSKYTYNEHVLPILRERCGSCHADGGVAPMSLMTYAETFPWAESIKGELLAAHMPPWSAVDGIGRFKRARTLSARELDVLLTWATGGTPEGPSPDKMATPAVVTPSGTWTLGTPDLVVPIPDEVTLAPGQLEVTREFVLPADGLAGRAIRAADLLPGTPAIVRRAVIFIRAPATTSIVTLWLPGGDAVLPDEAAFAAPAQAELVARITFRKTWKYENTAMRDRSLVGVYFAAPSARPIESIELSPERAVVMPESVDAVAIRADVDRPDADLELHATLPDGTRVPMIRLTTQPEWPRRYWLADPMRLPRGTRLETMLSGGGDPVGDRRTGVAVDVVRQRSRTRR